MEQENKARWYVINVHSGFEKKTVALIEEYAAKKGISSYFEEMLVPSESVIEIKRGQKVEVEKQCFPGYILVKMVLNDAAWLLVKNVPKVSSFLGANGRPSPVSEREVKRILKQVEQSVEAPRHVYTFDVGESVRVTDGPFTSFSGVVEEVEHERGRLKVSVMIFGRPTPVELEFTQVEKTS